MFVSNVHCRPWALYWREPGHTMPALLRFVENAGRPSAICVDSLCLVSQPVSRVLCPCLGTSTYTAIRLYLQRAYDPCPIRVPMRGMHLRAVTHVALTICTALVGAGSGMRAGSRRALPTSMYISFSRRRPVATHRPGVRLLVRRRRRWPPPGPMPRPPTVHMWTRCSDRTPAA